jgi:hypothetical protein
VNSLKLIRDEPANAAFWGEVTPVHPSSSGGSEVGVVCSTRVCEPKVTIIRESFFLSFFLKNEARLVQHVKVYIPKVEQEINKIGGPEHPELELVSDDR